MPEGESKDDLFEDLDKFFAPIQDVDWPETRPPASRRSETPSEHAERGDAEPERAASSEPAEVPAGQEGLFEPVEEPASEAREPAPDEVEEPEVEEPEEEEEELSPETLAHPPSPYVDLPGPSEEEEEEEAVSELEEPEVEEPSLEAVEAAAEHFAESVRSEVRLEPEPVEESEATLPDLLAGGEPSEEEALLGAEEPSTRTLKVGAEGLGGPSWQEPTAVEVGAEHERRPMGRDVPAAFLTGLVLAALALGSIAIAAGAFAIVASAIVLWAQGEFYRALQKRHHQPATALGLVAGGLVLAGAYYRGEAAMVSMFLLAIVATFLWYMAVPSTHRKDVAANVGLTVLGVAYIPLLAGYALVLLKLPADARGIVVSVIGLTFAYDTAAFIVGSWWGSRPLAPTISPKKSIEGAVGATLVVIAVSVGAVAPSVGLLDTVGRSVGLAVVVAIFAPLGDLAESLLKRDLGLKDMGSVLPGHGGVLDRIDSVLFVIPAAFLFLRLILL